MGRKPDPGRRGELLAAAAVYLQEHGLAGLSLRPLAAALGVSPRTLLYHFGSKEQLVSEVALALQQRLEPPGPIVEAARSGSLAELQAALRAFWAGGTQPGAEPFLRLMLDVLAAALREPDAWRPFLGAAFARWHELLAEALRRHGRSSAEAELLASELVALNYGLALDLLATGDRGRTGRTVERALARLAAAES
jgi:AcrR family transcriptional regulator